MTSCTFALALAALLLYSLLIPGSVRAQEAGQQENLAGPCASTAIS